MQGVHDVEGSERERERERERDDCLRETMTSMKTGHTMMESG